jgi:drug/metabolite transporter (DMT)-like permease
LPAESPAVPETTIARGRLYVLAAAVLWSFGGVVTKGLPLPAGEIAFYRSLFAGLALLPLVRPDRVELRPVMLPGVLTLGAMIGLYIGAIKITTAANAIFLQCTAAFWLVLAGWLQGERPGRRTVEGIVVATVGIAAIVAYGHGGRPGEGRGILLGLASGVAYAAVVTLLRGLRRLDPIWLSAVNNLGGALALGAWLTATGVPPRLPATAGLVATLAAFGALQMALPYVLFARGLKTVPAPEAALIGLLEPVLNPVWVWLAHGEVPAPASLAGGAMLLAGLAVRYAPRRPPPGSPDR